MRIALADDDPAARDVLAVMLATLGHTVVGAVADGSQLLADCAQSNPDVVLVDLDMPGLDGLETAEQLWQAHHLPIVLISGHTDFQHVVRHQEPIKAFLAKPVSLDRLASALKNIAQDSTSTSAD